MAPSGPQVLPLTSHSNFSPASRMQAPPVEPVDAQVAVVAREGGLRLRGVDSEAHIGRQHRRTAGVEERVSRSRRPGGSNALAAFPNCGASATCTLARRPEPLTENRARGYAGYGAGGDIPTIRLLGGASVPNAQVVAK